MKFVCPSTFVNSARTAGPIVTDCEFGTLMDFNENNSMSSGEIGTPTKFHDCYSMVNDTGW